MTYNKLLGVKVITVDDLLGVRRIEVKTAPSSAYKAKFWHNTKSDGKIGVAYWEKV